MIVTGVYSQDVDDDESDPPDRDPDDRDDDDDEDRDSAVCCHEPRVLRSDRFQLSGHNRITSFRQCHNVWCSSQDLK